MSLQPGMKATLVHNVRSADLASSWGNDMPVFATPIMLWLAEIACMRAIEPAIDASQITLGYRHEVGHLAPTPENWTVTFTAELVSIEGKMLVFEVAAHDGVDTVLSGRHTRAMLARDRFAEKVRRKAAAPPVASCPAAGAVSAAAVAAVVHERVEETA
jgi:fluoroacetyl-CoA thioesterase